VASSAVTSAMGLNTGAALRSHPRARHTLNDPLAPASPRPPHEGQTVSFFKEAKDVLLGVGDGGSVARTQLWKMAGEGMGSGTH